MSTAARPAGFPFPESLRALRNRNYRLFIAGQVVSFIGSWAQSTALNWLILNVLMANSFQLGVFNFALQIPVLLLGILAGGVADRHNRHRLIVITQCVLMVHATALALLTLLHNRSGAPLLTYSMTLILAFISGVVQAFDLPARSAFLPQMVPPADLQNAVALNSLSFNAARVVGPAVAGGMLAWFARHYPDRPARGEAICFVFNALSYVAVLISLLRMKVDARPPAEHSSYSAAYLLGGMHYIFERTHIAGLFIHLVVMALFGIPYLLIIPVFAKEVLHGNASTFGQLMAAVGAGALLGGAIMAMRKSVRGLGRNMVFTSCGFSLLILLFARTGNLWTASVVIGAAGFCMVMTMIGSQTLAQTLVGEEIRGRVLSIYTMISVGMLPFGSLISGALAQHFGVRNAFTINGVVCLLTAAVFALSLPRLRASARATPEYQAATAS
jgi:MFS family permease